MIKDLLWWRVRSWYGNLLLSGRYGCSTWLLLVLILWKKSSSALLKSSAMGGKSSVQPLATYIRSWRCCRPNPRDTISSQNILTRYWLCRCHSVEYELHGITTRQRTSATSQAVTVKVCANCNRLFIGNPASRPNTCIAQYINMPFLFVILLSK